MLLQGHCRTAEMVGGARLLPHYPAACICTLVGQRFPAGLSCVSLSCWQHEMPSFLPAFHTPLECKLLLQDVIVEKTTEEGVGGVDYSFECIGSVEVWHAESYPVWAPASRQSIAHPPRLVRAAWGDLLSMPTCYDVGWLAKVLCLLGRTLHGRHAQISVSARSAGDEAGFGVHAQGLGSICGHRRGRLWQGDLHPALPACDRSAFASGFDASMLACQRMVSSATVGCCWVCMLFLTYLCCLPSLWAVPLPCYPDSLHHVLLAHFCWPGHPFAHGLLLEGSIGVSKHVPLWLSLSPRLQVVCGRAQPLAASSRGWMCPSWWIVT